MVFILAGASPAPAAGTRDPTEDDALAVHRREVDVPVRAEVAVVVEAARARERLRVAGRGSARLAAGIPGRGMGRIPAAPVYNANLSRGSA